MTPKPIILQEYQPRSLPADTFTQAEAQHLWHNHRPHVHVEPPSFQNDQRWVLTPQGWTGHLPVSRSKTLIIEPKVTVQNLFSMLQTVYRFKQFRFLDGITHTDTLAGFVDLLAHELANRVLNRLRAGIAKSYLEKREPVGVVRGRIDPKWLAQQPASAEIRCDFAEQTADLPFNQVLAYTLRQVALTGLCSQQTLRLVNRAWRQLPVTLTSFTASDLAGWEYTRLTQDYRPMHALCQLFLDSLAPTHRPNGANDGHAMLPFLVNMPFLYEQYVATWLESHLPSGYTLRKQARVQLDASHARHVDIDLVIVDPTGKPLIVLDTKYKSGEPSNDDIYQVAFYAREIGCQSAGLIYPTALAKRLTGRNQDVTYRSFIFALHDTPDAAGASFLAQLGSVISL